MRATTIIIIVIAVILVALALGRTYPGGMSAFIDVDHRVPLLTPVTTTVTNPVAPFCLSLRSGFPFFSRILVSGVVKNSGSSIDGVTNFFRLNLEKDDDNNALQVKVLTHESKNLIACNTKIGGTWQSEKHYNKTASPRQDLFKAGKQFTVDIFCHPDYMSVTVDETFLIRYAHVFKALDQLTKISISTNVADLTKFTMTRYECLMREPGNTALVPL